MGKFGLACKAFWRTLRDPSVAERIERVLSDDKYPALTTEPPAASPSAAPTPVKPKSPPRPGRSDALNLLAALQREARFVDFIQEPISAYSDAQIGAAVRDVHRDCAAVIDRVFALRPTIDGEEGSVTEVPVGFDSAVFRLVGNVSGEPPYRGQLTHHGWQATRCELPAWIGSDAAAMIVAPAEVELK